MILPRSSFAVLVTALFLPSPGLGQAVGDALVLQPGDAVRLAVGREPELGGEFPVQEDGRILLPLVGFVSVADVPFGEVRATIEAGFEGELKDAEVAVTPLVRVAVLGEVRVPGLVPADPTLTLSEIVASAGGLAPEGDPARVTVLRAGGTLSYSLEDGSAAGYRVRSGDQIVVGRRSWAFLNRSLLVTTGASVVTAVLTALLLR